MFKRFGLNIVIASFAVIALISIQPIHAQDRSGILHGVVKDAAGAPVAGAFVKLNNSERRLTFMVISQAQGRYSVNNLPNGKYTVQAIGGEFQSELSAPINLADTKPANVDLALTAKRAPQLPGAWPGRLPGEQVGEGGEGGRAAAALPEGEGKPIAVERLQAYRRVKANRSSKRSALPATTLSVSHASKPIAIAGKRSSKTCGSTLRVRRSPKR